MSVSTEVRGLPHPDDRGSAHSRTRHPALDPGLRARTVVRAGADFADGRRLRSANVPLQRLPEVGQPIEAIAADVLRTGEPAVARRIRVAEGVVTSHGRTGVPPALASMLLRLPSPKLGSIRGAVL